MAADAAFLVGPAGLGLLAHMTSVTSALYATAGIVTAANLSFAYLAREQVVAVAQAPCHDKAALKSKAGTGTGTGSEDKPDKSANPPSASPDQKESTGTSGTASH
jgi:hypothetical protein